MLCSTQVKTKSCAANGQNQMLKTVKIKCSVSAELLVLTIVLHIRFWHFYYTMFDFKIFTTQYLMLNFLIHSIGFEPFYCTTLGFDQCTTHSNLLFLLHNIWFWNFYYARLGFDLLLHNIGFRLFLLHNCWFWPLYYTTFDFDIFTTQHLILTFLLRNIWFRPFHNITLDFDRFTTPDSILTCLLYNIWFWPFYYTTLCRTVYHKTPVYSTTFGLDLFTTQLCVGQSVTEPFVVQQCTTKPNFAVRCTEIPNIENRVDLYF